MNFCAIGSERISFLGFERCVSAAEAIHWGVVVAITLLIMLLLVWTLWSIHAAWLNHRLRNLESVNTALMHELHTPNKELHQYSL
jgi:hypothetical protein